MPYGSLEEERRGHLDAGTCAFKTCSRFMRIPASYLISLLKAEYTGSVEPRDAKTAVHHWLLVQMLDAIGSYTIV